MGTLTELFVHNDWAWSKIVAAVRPLNQAQLDESFEIGRGTLRETIRHLYSAERFWFECWQGRELTEAPHSHELSAVDDLDRAHHQLAAARNDYLEQAGSDGLGGQIDFTDGRGRPHSALLGSLGLHVVNHGCQHRAQAANMLRRLGVEAPGLDYLFMRLERPTIDLPAEMTEQWRAGGFEAGSAHDAPAQLDLDTIHEYYRYGDWAAARVLAVAADLDDNHLDREFEIGLGTLRKTLMHIRDAEEWWCNYWTETPQPDDLRIPDGTSSGDLTEVARKTAERRDEFLRAVPLEALERPVTVEARPGTKLTFRLGETLLQLPGHGTHHRAQALNMLRRIGAKTPTLDYDDCLQEQARI